MTPPMKHLIAGNRSIARRIFLFLIVAIVLNVGGCKKKPPQPLDVLTPPSLHAVVGELGGMFEQNYGIPVHVKPVDLSHVDCETHDDILFCYDPQKSKSLDETGCVADILPLSYTFPVFVLPKDNPRQITNLEELLAQDLKIAIQDQSDKLRQLADRYFPGHAPWPEIDSKASLVDELKKSTCDAVLTWKFIADNYGEDQVTIIPLPNDPESTVNIDVLVLTHCKDIPTYNAFLKTLTSKSGRDILKKHNLASVFR